MIAISTFPVEKTDCHQNLHDYCQFEEVETFYLDIRQFPELSGEIDSL